MRTHTPIPCHTDYGEATAERSGGIPTYAAGLQGFKRRNNREVLNSTLYFEMSAT
jgi:hypothetical protein